MIEFAKERVKDDSLVVILDTEIAFDNDLVNDVNFVKVLERVMELDNALVKNDILVILSVNENALVSCLNLTR